MIEFPKILSASQTRESDAYTIKHKSIASIDLMENASLAFVEAIRKDLSKSNKIAVFCGTGNNGGDGLAIARILRNLEFKVEAFLVRFNTSLSEDCAINLGRLDKVIEITPSSSWTDFSEFDIIIDSILGSGLKRPVSGFLEKLIQNLNDSKSKVYAVDISSGLFCDTIKTNIIAVKADKVISFQRPKMAFFFPEYKDFIKSWEAVNIGLDEDFIQQQESRFFLLNDTISQAIQVRNRYSHKGTYGHSLLISGSIGKMGAAILASKACLKSGTGLLTVQVPKCGYQIMQTAVPEAMCRVDVSTEFISECPQSLDYSVIGFGPGLGTHPLTQEAFEEVLNHYDRPMVIDADALNCIAQNKNLLTKIPKQSVLTPHVKEFDRLFGSSKNSLERYKKQIHFSKELDLIIVLKDAHTAICSPNEEIFFNFTGNPGMATGGSGDVLTGMITGLMAQKYPSLIAALAGVYFHGLAGDEAKKDVGELGLIASDIINHIHISNEERT